MNLVLGNVWFMAIFEDITENGCVIEGDNLTKLHDNGKTVQNSM